MKFRTHPWLFVTLVLLLGLPAAAAAQEEEGGPSVHVAGQLASQFVWRGYQESDKPNLQPDVWVELGGLAVGVWGSFALDGSFYEVDYYLSWWSEVPGGELTLTWQDYYNPDAEGELGDLFNFKGDGEGAHTVEILAEFAPSALPLTFTAGWNAINDPDKSLFGAVKADLSLPAFDVSPVVAWLLNDSPWYYGGDAGDLMYYGATLTKQLPAVGDFIPYLQATVVRSPIEEATFWVVALGF